MNCVDKSKKEEKTSQYAILFFVLIYSSHLFSSSHFCWKNVQRVGKKALGIINDMCKAVASTTINTRASSEEEERNVHSQLWLIILPRLNITHLMLLSLCCNFLCCDAIVNYNSLQFCKFKMQAHLWVLYDFFLRTVNIMWNVVSRACISSLWYSRPHPCCKCECVNILNLVLNIANLSEQSSFSEMIFFTHTHPPTMPHSLSISISISVAFHVIFLVREHPLTFTDNNQCLSTSAIKSWSIKIIIVEAKKRKNIKCAQKWNGIVWRRRVLKQIDG